MKNIHLLIVDPQNDFCDPQGSLYIPGADDDMLQLASFIHRWKDQISQIHVTLDSHRRLDIAHPLWWQDAHGKSPQPFTLISPEDIQAGRWNAVVPAFQERTAAYIDSLHAKGRYPHTIWPEHCLLGSWGHNIFSELLKAIQAWEKRRIFVNYVIKGMNPWTEHFSAVRAEVPDPEDSSTATNNELIESLSKADQILVAGEASTHCVMSTVEDLSDYYAEKIVWLSDATSPVPNPPNTMLFSDRLNSSLVRLKNLGMCVEKTVNFNQGGIFNK
ncbi:MAG: isochorismatase family protein [Gammaproteobacteria bacterium]|nr:isochorismatase family protein [Gammaproteobacteria bacterium]